MILRGILSVFILCFGVVYASWGADAPLKIQQLDRAGYVAGTYKDLQFSGKLTSHRSYHTIAFMSISDLVVVKNKKPVMNYTNGQWVKRPNKVNHDMVWDLIEDLDDFGKANFKEIPDERAEK